MTHPIAVGVFSAIVLVAMTDPSVARTWTNLKGQQFEGDFVSCDDAIVKISRKSDGKVFNIPLTTLGDGDQAFVKAQKRTGVQSPKAPPARNADVLIKELDELTTIARVSKKSSDMACLRMALYALDAATEAKKPTDAEKTSRQKARSVLAMIPLSDAARQDQLWKLYRAGFFGFGDTNVVHKGERTGIKTVPGMGPDRWQFCPNHNRIPGFVLYKEDIDLIMAHAAGIVTTFVATREKGSCFLGHVNLLDDGDLVGLAEMFRTALGLEGGKGVLLEFHEGPKGTVVIADAKVIAGPRFWREERTSKLGGKVVKAGEGFRLEPLTDELIVTAGTHPAVSASVKFRCTLPAPGKGIEYRPMVVMVANKGEVTVQQSVMGSEKWPDGVRQRNIYIGCPSPGPGQSFSGNGVAYFYIGDSGFNCVSNIIAQQVQFK